MATKTGKGLAIRLEQYDTETGLPTGVVKYNFTHDEDRIDPYDSGECLENYTFVYDREDSIFVCEDEGLDYTYVFDISTGFSGYICDI